jgi:ABC-type lipoprotein release transport system permease subunit
MKKTINTHIEKSEAQEKVERLIKLPFLGGGIFIGIYFLGIIGAVLGAVIGVVIGLLISNLLVSMFFSKDTN